MGKLATNRYDGKILIVGNNDFAQAISRATSDGTNSHLILCITDCYLESESLISLWHEWMPGDIHSIWNKASDTSEAHDLFEQLTVQNPEIVRGRMIANVLWTEDPNIFEIYSPRGWQQPLSQSLLSSNWFLCRRCRVKNDRINVKRLIGKCEYSVSDVESVHAWVSDYAFYEVLSLVCKGGAKRTIFRQSDIMNGLNFCGTTPPWDSHELYWAGKAAKQLARVIGVPWYFRDPDTWEMKEGNDKSCVL